MLSADIGAEFAGSDCVVYCFPVVARSVCVAVDVVAVDIELAWCSLMRFLRITVFTVGGQLHQSAFVFGGGTALVVVVHHVYLSGRGVQERLTTVGGVAAPVVDYVIDIVDRAFASADEVVVEARITGVVMCQKVMMERSVYAAPDAAIAVSSFSVNGIA